MTKEQTLKALYSAISSDSASEAASLMTTNVSRIEFEHSSFQGKDQLQKHLEDGRSTWAEGACTPVDFMIEGDKVLVHVHIHVRLKNKTEWIEGHVTDGFRFNQGLIEEFHSFSDKIKALAWFHS